MKDSKIIDFTPKNDRLPHAKQHFLCPDCEAEIVKVAEAGRDGQHIQYCEDNFVFAVATVRMGAIVQWDLRGPILKSVAKVLADEYVAHYRAAGVEAKHREDFN